MMPANGCRHFLGMFPDPRPQCAKGRNVRAWAKRCNGGSDLGIGLRLPCTRQSTGAEKPLFDCPELDRRTDAEVQAERERMRLAMDRLVTALPALNEVKSNMLDRCEAHRTITCPMCGASSSMSVSVAIGGNNHMAAQCSRCGEGFIE